MTQSKRSICANFQKLIVQISWSHSTVFSRSGGLTLGRPFRLTTIRRGDISFRNICRRDNWSLDISRTIRCSNIWARGLFVVALPRLGNYVKVRNKARPMAKPPGGDKGGRSPPARRQNVALPLGRTFCLTLKALVTICAATNSRRRQFTKYMYCFKISARSNGMISPFFKHYYELFITRTTLLLEYLVERSG